jgi:hypothetical protein
MPVKTGITAKETKEGKLLSSGLPMPRINRCKYLPSAGIEGIGPIPPIAGRSPTYTMRQLYEFQHGGRAGNASALMKPTVEKLSQDDMIALAAYVGSVEP